MYQITKEYLEFIVNSKTESSLPRNCYLKSLRVKRTRFLKSNKNPIFQFMYVQILFIGILNFTYVLSVFSWTCSVTCSVSLVKSSIPQLKEFSDLSSIGSDVNLDRNTGFQFTSIPSSGLKSVNGLLVCG